jgi:salicylate hydroxylase
VAKQHGVKFFLDARVERIQYADPSKPVLITTYKGDTHKFDMVLGADGVSSIVRKTLYPKVKPTPPTGNCAYRALIPYDTIRADPDPAMHDLVKDLTMEVWMAPNAYIISYPISAGRLFNMVLSHHVPLDKYPAQVGKPQDVTLDEVWEQYKDFDPRIVKILHMLKPGIQRWPLLVTEPLPSWSDENRRVILLGDAAHSMTNHMAQGAATAMEDGAFLGIVIGAALQGKMSLKEAVELYEKERMPKAKRKQDVSFLNGAIWHLSGEQAEARNRVMSEELPKQSTQDSTSEYGSGKVLMRSPNLYGDPSTVLEVYGYDAEVHAQDAVARHLNGGKEVWDDIRLPREAREKIVGWFLDEKGHFDPKAKL